MVRAQSAIRTNSAVSEVVNSSPACCNGALEAPRAKVILPSFHERRLELDRQDFPQDRDVLVEQLFLEIDRVRRDHGFFLLLDREENRRRQIRDRFADAGPGFDHEVPLLLQSAGHGYRHLLLLGPVLEVLCLRQQSGFGKEGPDLFDEVTAERISKSDHGLENSPAF